MKYNDGKYHVEWMTHEYLGGYKSASWTIVNVYGEPCRDKTTLTFDTKENAHKYCNKLNITPEGGVLTNLL